MPFARVVGVLSLALALALAAGPTASGAPVASPASGPTPVFSGARAMSWLRAQCALGPRNPGSPGHQQLQRLIGAHADSLGLACAPAGFRMDDPYGDGQLDVRNYVISAGPRGGTRLWIAAHYDTRPRSERDPDPVLAARPLLGANDGASGVAVLLHLAELLAAHPPARGVDLIFLDAEDYGREGDVANYCLGATHLAAHWREFGSPLAGGRPAGLVLLDMVGQRDLAIPMEGYSLRQAAAWTRAIFARAAELGLDAFVPTAGPAIWDDHVPFLKAGIPAVDLIDFDYAQWHTSRDTPAACDPASLEQVGRLVTDLCYRPAL